VIRSLPALLIAQKHPSVFRAEEVASAPFPPFVPAYQIAGEEPCPVQAEQAARAVAVLAERLVRLDDAYPAWERFEAGPYFDLYPPQAGSLCRVQEEGEWVHVILYPDLLVPAFRAAILAWRHRNLLAASLTRVAQGAGDGQAPPLADWMQAEAALQHRLAEARRIIAEAMRLLYQSGDLNFLFSHAAVEERLAAAARCNGAGAEALAELQDVPTLTLARSFRPPLRPATRRRALLRQRLRGARRSGYG